MVSAPSRLGEVDNKSLLIAHALGCAELDSPNEFAALQESHTQICCIAYQTGTLLPDITHLTEAQPKDSLMNAHQLLGSIVSSLSIKHIFTRSKLRSKRLF